MQTLRKRSPFEIRNVTRLALHRSAPGGPGLGGHVSPGVFPNQLPQPDHLVRTTGQVLGFKGLSFNLAYGLIGILYSFLIAYLSPPAAGQQPFPARISFEKLVYIKSLFRFPWYFLAAAVIVIFYARLKMKGLEQHKIAG